MPGGWTIPAAWGSEFVDQHKNHPCCVPCSRGEPCDAWDWAALAEHGVTPRVRGDRRVRLNLPATPPTDARRQEAARLLGVKPDATAAEVTAAFRALAHVHHPDKGGDAATMAKLVAARALLLDA